MTRWREGLGEREREREREREKERERHTFRQVDGIIRRSYNIFDFVPRTLMTLSMGIYVLKIPKYKYPFTVKLLNI